MGVPDLAEAAEAFLHHFLGLKNWLLWTQLREKHGFHTNQDFAAWMLQVIQQLNYGTGGPVQEENKDRVVERNNNKANSMNNNNLDNIGAPDSNYHQANGVSSSHESTANGEIPAPQDDDVDSGHARRGKIIHDHSALNLSNMLNSSRIYSSASGTAGDMQRRGGGEDSGLASSNDTSLDLSIDKVNGVATECLPSEDDDDVGDDADKPLNVQQFNKGGVRPRGNIEQICCTTCCKSFPTEIMYNSHTCSRTSKDRRKSSEPSKFVAPRLMDDDDDDSLGVFDAEGGEETGDAAMNGSVHGCSVCGGMFSSADTLKLHACKLSIAIPQHRPITNGDGENGEDLDESPLSVDYWDEDTGEDGALDFSRDFVDANGKLCGESDVEMEGIVGSSSLSQSGVSSSSPDPRLVPCNMCGKMLMGNRAVIRHIRTVHMRIRKFHCSVCDRRFARNEHLKRHKCSRRSRIAAV